MRIHPRFYEAVKYLYPKMERGDFQLRDVAGGEGPVLVYWNLSKSPPTEDEILQALAAIDKGNENAAVLAKIAEIEAKQARAVREHLLAPDANPLTRLQELDAEIVALRAQLIS